MKCRGKIHFYTILSFLSLLVWGLVSCGGAPSGFVGESQADWIGDTVVQWTYNGTQVQYELPANTRTVQLEANEAVDIFMVKMNMGTDIIPAVSTRYIVPSGRASADDTGGSSRNVVANLDALENISGVSASGIVRKDFAPARDFVPPFPGRGGSSRSASNGLRSVAAAPVRSVVPTDWQVNSTKNLWVDLKNSAIGTRYEEKWVGMSRYTQRPATVKAVGTHCYVWVVDNDGSSLTISEQEAKTLADKFDGMYTAIRNVFGNESDKMIDASGLVDIASASDTGNKVNIVIYDIEGDYSPNQTGGTMGYFWAKDYYTTAAAGATNDAAIGITNGGKYFYVDSGFLKLYENMVYSTLAHEFQHMINFGQKTMRSMETAKTEKAMASQTWSNEMMSMVCEDMIQQYLGLPTKDSPIARLPAFCQYYYLSGLTEWLSGNYVIASYAGAYAFGAYLARNYGDISLIKEIATNGYVDQEAITEALRAIGTNETFESVFQKYAQALVLDKPPTPANAPTFNKSAAGIGDKQMSAIDIFNIETTDQYGRLKKVSPGLFKNDSTGRVDLRPYGFTLHSVGYTSSAGKVQLTFSSPVNTNEKVYLLVQPHSSRRWQ